MIATTTVDIFRDADSDLPDVERDTNAWGDEVETDPVPADGVPTAIATAVPASIIERSQRVRDDAGGLRPVRYVVGRVHSDVAVREGDRLRDNKDGAWYSVESTSQAQSPFMTLDVRMELELIDKPEQPWTLPAPLPSGFGYGFGVGDPND